MSGASSTFSAPVQTEGVKLWLQFTFNSDEDASDELDFIVDPSKIRRIYSVKLDSRVSGRLRIFNNAELIGSVRTSAAAPSGIFDFANGYDLIAGDDFHLDFQPIADQAICEVSVFVQLTESDS